MVMDRGSWSAEATKWPANLSSPVDSEAWKVMWQHFCPRSSGDRCKRTRNVVIRVLKGASTEITSITNVQASFALSTIREPEPVVTLLAAAIGLY